MENNKVIIHPCVDFKGRLRVPGDKSISQRVAILSAISSGVSYISGILKAEDCLDTTGALEALGAKVVFNGDILEITGTGGNWRVPDHALYLGNSGTGMRLLSGLLAGAPITVELTGDKSLSSRPMRRIKEPLELMGAKVELMGAKGCAPIRIKGGNLKGIEYQMPVASAQVKSCILLASLRCSGVTRLRELLPTRDHTELLFKAVGIPFSQKEQWIEIEGFGEAGPKLAGREWVVPGDFSSAAFWLAAGAILPEARVNIEGVGLNPHRIGFLRVIEKMGAQTSITPYSNSNYPEPCGEIEVKNGCLKGIEVGGEAIPGIIDELPLLAAVGALAQGTTIIRDAAELRVKESDRIACTAANLRLLGVSVEERADGIIVEGGSSIHGNVTLDSYGDHRIAMAMSILALRASEPVIIKNVACVRTSYPDFWQHMRSFGAHVQSDCCN